MQGPIENALMLVAAGNKFLSGKSIAGFWPKAPTFMYLKSCEFRVPPPSGKDSDEHPLFAKDPMEWLAKLKPTVKGFRLHANERDLEPGQMPGMTPRMLVGFVGGGPRWLVEAVEEGKSGIWEGFDRVGDRNDPDRKLWLKTYIRVGEATPDQVHPVSLDESVAEMRAVLPQIEAYAREEKLDNFADCFARAQAALDEPAPEIAGHLRNALSYADMAEQEMRVFTAVQDAWVFGGMGSWNDNGGGPRYDELSERLFDALCGAVCGIANSTYRG